ncbi:MAG: dihydrofolate reductase family protein [Dyadobacter fermentans]
MRKIIAAINMTLDGFCDHTAVSPDAAVHDHYGELLKNAGAALFGRKTYLLMEFWKGLVEEPSGEKSMDDFAKSIDGIPKIVFSRTLQSVDWKSAKVATRDLEAETRALREEDGSHILVCSRSLMIALMNAGLVDEFQLMVHPVVARQGLPLFDELDDDVVLTLTNTHTFGSGAVLLHYAPSKKQ